MTQAFYMGSAYYPEDWDEAQLEGDIRQMQELGLNVARVGEFAWHKLEPKEGEYHLEWLETVVNKLADAGIQTILGTPTATPPHWLLKKHPNIAVLLENGRRQSHGGRRHCCSNNPDYLYHAGRMVETLAACFGNHPNVIGWQMDNEIYPWGMGCTCPVCHRMFQAYLETKYGTVEHLNRSWNLELFSQAYDSFMEIPIPIDGWHNPHIRYEWLTFQANSHLRFLRYQANILKTYTRQPIGTDLMPFGGLDYEQVAEFSDVLQFNHYNTPEDFWRLPFWFDYLRPLLPRPFWNTETSTGWNGGTDIAQSIKPEGFCRVNTLLPYLLGGEANLYWLWRTHWAGHELTHGAVVSACGRPLHMVGEIRQAEALLERAGEFLRETRVDTPIALHFSARVWNLFQTQTVVSGLRYGDAVQETVYRPLTDLGLRPDVIGPSADLEGYKVLLSPFLLTLEDGEQLDLAARIGAWVRQGGVWIVGPMTDIRTEYGANYKTAPFGMLERLTGVTCLYQVPDNEGRITCRWMSGEPFSGSRWYDVFAEDADALVRISAGHSALENKPVVLRKQVGRGQVILLGTLPESREMERILRLALEAAGVPLPQVTGQVTVIPRKGAQQAGLILAETGGAAATYTLPAPMLDLETGEQVSGTVPLDPYQVRIFQE